MASIITNASALTALQSLNATNKNLEITQSRISTGYRVAEASDNAAYWSIATTMRSDNKALSTVQDALGLGASKIDTAYTGMNKAIETAPTPSTTSSPDVSNQRSLPWVASSTTPASMTLRSPNSTTASAPPTLPSDPTAPVTSPLYLPTSGTMARTALANFRAHDGAIHFDDKPVTSARSEGFDWPFKWR